MRKIIFTILMLLSFFLASAQDRLTVIHFNYKWNTKNDYNLRGLKHAKIQYAFLEDQPEEIRQSIKAVPVIVILGKDGKVKMQYTADISFKIHATKEEIQSAVNRILINQ